VVTELVPEQHQQQHTGDRHDHPNRPGDAVHLIRIVEGHRVGPAHCTIEANKAAATAAPATTPARRWRSGA